MSEPEKSEPHVLGPQMSGRKCEPQVSGRKCRAAKVRPQVSEHLYMIQGKKTTAI
jgi:hypothetical protein